MTSNGGEAGHERMEDGGQPPRRRLWPRILLGLLLLLVVGGGLLVGRMLGEPIWTELLAGSAASRIEAGLGPGATVDVGVVGFALDGSLRPELHFRDIVASRPGVGTISVDTLSVGVGWSTAPRRAERIVADHVLLEIADTGAPLPSATAMLAALDAALAAPPLGYLEIGSLTVFHRAADGSRITALDRAAVTLIVGTDGSTDLTLAGTGDDAPWSIRSSGLPAEGGEGRTLDLRAAGLDLGMLAAMAGQGQPPVTGPVSFEGSITLAEGRITAGGGQVNLGPLVAGDEGARPLVGGYGRLEVSLRPDGRTVVVIPSPVSLPGGQAVLSGEISVPDEPAATWPFQLHLAVRGTGPGDERRGLGDVEGSYDPAAGLLVVDRLQATGEGATFTAAMRLAHADSRIAGALSGAVPSMSVATLKAVWPEPLVSDARKWVVENVESGMIHDATVDLTASDGAITAVPAASATAAVAFRFDELAFRAFDDGPMIRGASGAGKLEGGRFTVTLDGGWVDLGADGRLEIPSGTFLIPDMSVDPPNGEIDFMLAGGAAETIALWRTLPIAAGHSSLSAPSGATGEMQAEVHLSLPLVSGVAPEQVAYSGSIELTGLGFAEPLDGRKFTDGDLSIRIADGAARITGDALIDGVSAKVDVVEPLSGEGEAASAVTLRLTGKDRDRLGVELGKVLVGPVDVTIVTTTDEAGEEVQAVEADLSQARLRIAPLGVAKPKGTAASVRFRMRRHGARTEIEDLVFEGDGARITGGLSLDGNGRLLAARLPKIVARAGDNLALRAERDADGVLVVTVTGSRFDARRLVRSQLRGGDATGLGEAVRLDVTIDAVTGFGEETLTGFNLAAALRDGTVTAMSLAAQTEGSGSVSMTLTPVRSDRRIEMEVGEAGRLMRFLGVYGRIYGGRAVVTGVVDRSGGVRVAVDGSRLKIVDEPALARLSTAAESGPGAGRATVEIERLLFNLAFAGGILRIEDGVVRAATAGLSIQGDVDFSRDTLRLGGTYLPASAFDSLLGKIPLIGPTVFAGGRAGLLGVTFRLSGPIDGPTLSVNPLSAIAPGIFRKMFELR